MTLADTAVLEACNLTRRFGGLTAVNDFSFKVMPGTIHGPIGPNGAGKTTTWSRPSASSCWTGGRAPLR